MRSDTTFDNVFNERFRHVDFGGYKFSKVSCIGFEIVIMISCKQPKNAKIALEIFPRIFFSKVSSTGFRPIVLLDRDNDIM